MQGLSWMNVNTKRNRKWALTDQCAAATGLLLNLHNVKAFEKTHFSTLKMNEYAI